MTDRASPHQHARPVLRRRARAARWPPTRTCTRGSRASRRAPSRRVVRDPRAQRPRVGGPGRATSAASRSSRARRCSTSTCGIATTRASGSGPPARGSSTARTSPRAIACGPTCRSCGPWRRSWPTRSTTGSTPDGAGCHDLLGTRCDPYVNQLLSDTAYDFHCHSNLVRAVLPFGLTEFDVHDVINVFQVTGLMPDDERYFMKPCPARVGDHFELFAETDLLMAASTCPGGDLVGADVGAGRRRGAALQPDRRRGVLRVPDDLLAGWRPRRARRLPGRRRAPAWPAAGRTGTRRTTRRSPSTSDRRMRR